MNLTDTLSLISLPVELHLPIYLRKSFEFNLGFLVSPECLKANRLKLERILRQIMFQLLQMEYEKCLLSSAD
jgi:hypothetical protein